MIQNNLLAEINFDNVPNIKEIGPEYMDMAKDFDPENKYAVPYCWGTEGILYNKQRFDELGIPYPTKWADLWNPELEGEILMHNTLCIYGRIKDQRLLFEYHRPGSAG